MQPCFIAGICVHLIFIKAGGGADNIISVIVGIKINNRKGNIKNEVRKERIPVS